MLKRSMFGLEIEKGRRVLSRSLLLVMLFIVIASAVAYVNLSIAPTLPPELLKPPTPTPNIFATPLSSPTPAGGQPTPTIELAPTVTLAVPNGNQPLENPVSTLTSEPAGPPVNGQTPEVEDTPTVPATAPGVVCSPGASISSPPTGAIVSSVVTFFGTASGEDFGRYELDALGPQTGGSWTALPVEGSTQPVFDNILGAVDVSSWLSGTHSFRLSVFDSQEDVIGQCEIQLTVETGGAS